MLAHHPNELLIALGALVMIALMIRIVIGNPRGARHRVRILRWRIRLYLRPGPGYANILELCAGRSCGRSAPAAGPGRRCRGGPG